MLRHPIRLVVLYAFLAIAATGTIFITVSLVVFDTFIDARITLSNLSFLLLVYVLLWLFWNEVKSNSACKTFVFLVSVAYGSIITIAVSALATPLGFPDITDLRLYSPEKLGVFAILELITLPIGCWLMLHVVRPLVAEKIYTKVWVRFNVLPIGIFLLLVLIYWIPLRSIDSASAQIALLAGVLVIGVVAIFAWAFVIFRDLKQAREQYDGMAKRVVVLEREQQKQRERQEQRTRKQREEKINQNNNLSKVVFETPSRVLALELSTIQYLEVFGHTLVIHVAGGHTEQLNLSLTQARALLPEEGFIQCHRSYVVNKNAIHSLCRYELLLQTETLSL